MMPDEEYFLSLQLKAELERNWGLLTVMIKARTGRDVTRAEAIRIIRRALEEMEK